MKNLILVGLVIFGLVLVQFAQAQTMEDIINKHVTAMGGKEKIITLSTALMTGTFTAIGSTSAINIKTAKKHLVGSRIDIESEGTSNFQVINQKGGWIFTPVQGDKEPRPLMEDQTKAAQVQLDLHGPFLNYREKGIKVEMAGKDTVNGVLCNKLKATFPNTNVTVYFIDSKSGFIIKTSTKMFQFGAMEEVETIYGNYKQNEEGYWFAYTNAGPRGATNYDKITTNVAVDVNIFKVN
ncbi:MAG: hypothetical protein JNM14_06730 [Ferruginibacter sp.]|nr:hypothetical protein [Ferruginibacter sp.]